MKPLLYFFILTFSKVALSQNIVVLDSITGAPIDNVNVFSEKFGTTSNKSGQIDLDSFGTYDTLSFSHISYNVISIIKSKLNSDVILLSPKSNLLPDITLNDEKKLLFLKICLYLQLTLKRSLICLKAHLIYYQMNQA